MSSSEVAKIWYIAISYFAIFSFILICNSWPPDLLFIFFVCAFGDYLAITFICFLVDIRPLITERERQLGLISSASNL